VATPKPCSAPQRLIAPKPDLIVAQAANVPFACHVESERLETSRDDNAARLRVSYRSSVDAGEVVMADLEVDSNLNGTVGTSVSGAIDTNVAGSFGAVGPVTLSGIPDTYTFKIEKFPKIQFGVDSLQGTLKLEPVQIELAPISTSIAITGIPSVRTHLPMNYCVGLSVLGIELAAIRLCGEGMVITEPYEPEPCEVCGHGGARLEHGHRQTD
jgi:hypothetical protein